MEQGQDTGERYQILIVDDTPANLRLLYETLKDEYELYGAGNGKDALKMAETLHPDLILLDVMMPEMNGFEVCRTLKSNPATADTPVIFLTALTEELSEMAGFEAGAVDYIMKPFKPMTVRIRVKNQLSLSRQRLLLAQKNRELEEALTNVKVLSGLLPICLMCKKIRDDRGYWNRLEAYISKHSDAQFSHGYCNECFEKHMQELAALHPN